MTRPAFQFAASARDSEAITLPKTRRESAKTADTMDWDALLRASVPIEEVHQDTVQALIVAANALEHRRP
jgi:hypothetical protein